MSTTMHPALNKYRIQCPHHFTHIILTTSPECPVSVSVSSVRRPAGVATCPGNWDHWQCVNCDQQIKPTLQFRQDQCIVKKSHYTKTKTSYSWCNPELPSSKLSHLHLKDREVEGIKIAMHCNLQCWEVRVTKWTPGSNITFISIRASWQDMQVSPWWHLYSILHKSWE